MTAPRKPPSRRSKYDDEDVSQANGRDHLAESEHDHKRQKLHGESAKRTNVPPKGQSPARGKPGQRRT